MFHTSKHHIGTGKSQIRAAFTLIELLVVIAIIAILAAILFPVFARARENGRRAACQSNLKQLGLGILQYQQDYDETCPQGALSYKGIYGMGWAGQIYPYVKSTQVYTCPSDASGSTAPNTNISYGYNLIFAREPALGADGHLSSLTAPTKSVLLFETTGIACQPAKVSDASSNYNNYSPTGEGFGLYAFDGYGTGGKYATGAIGGQYDPGQFDGLKGRHLDGANYLMGDGHVKWYRGDAVSRGNRPANSTDPQGTDGGNRSEGTEYSGPGAHAVTFSTK